MGLKQIKFPLVISLVRGIHETLESGNVKSLLGKGTGGAVTS